MRNEAAIAASIAKIEGSYNFKQSWPLHGMWNDGMPSLSRPIDELEYRMGRYNSTRAVTRDLLDKFTPHNPNKEFIAILRTNTLKTLERTASLCGASAYYKELSKHDTTHLYLVGIGSFGVATLQDNSVSHPFAFWKTTAALTVSANGEIKIFQPSNISITLEHILTWDYLQIPSTKML